MLVFVAFVEVWHKGVKGRDASERTIRLEDNVLAELVVSRLVDDEGAMHKIVVRDALGIGGGIADTVGLG